MLFKISAVYDFPQHFAGKITTFCILLSSSSLRISSIRHHLFKSFKQALHAKLLTIVLCKLAFISALVAVGVRYVPVYARISQTWEAAIDTVVLVLYHSSSPFWLIPSLPLQSIPKLTLPSLPVRIPPDLTGAYLTTPAKTRLSSRRLASPCPPNKDLASPSLSQTRLACHALRIRTYPRLAMPAIPLSYPALRFTQYRSHLPH